MRKKLAGTRFVHALLLVFILCFATASLHAQNINRPNKMAPMGIEVNTATGNVFLERSDVYIPARQLDFDISFSYNSVDYLRNSGYGAGWTFAYNMRYRFDTAGHVIITWGNGREDAYTQTGNGLKAPVGIFDSLSQYTTGKYKLRQTDGLTYFFDDASHKRLTKISEPNGNYLQFGYTDSLMTSIGNAAGQTVTLTYSGGRLSSVTDANASPVQTYTYTYDAYGNLTKVTDPMGGTMKYTYLVNGPLSSVTDKNNNVADVVYYPGFAAWEIISCNSRVGFSYDTTTHTSTVIDFLENGSNQTTTYTYNANGWLSKWVGACCGYNMEFTYDNSGNLVTRKDGNGNIYKYTYDNRGNYLTETDPLNNVTTFTYGANFSELTGIVDPLGNVYSTTYDAAGNPTQMTRPGGSQSNMTYAANGDLLSSTDGSNNMTTYQYNAYGYPQTATAPLNMQAQATFDARGNLVASKDPNGNTYSFLYDSLNRLKQTTDALNRTVKMSYDKAGNLTAFTDAKGFTQSLYYDASDRVVSYKNGRGDAYSIAYDAMNNPIQFTDAAGNKTTFAYDRQSRPLTITDALGNGYSLSYDAAGNAVSMVKPNGNTVNYTYDGLNRVIGGSDAIGTLGSVAYDKNGNIASYTNATGAVISFAYDNLNRLTKITDPLGNSRTFTYDNNDNLLTLKDRNNNVSSYAYNALNRTVSVTDNNNNVITVAYDSVGNVTKATDQKGAVTTYQYDAANRPFKMNYPDGSYLQLTYDGNDNIIAERLADGSTITYAYDSANRLVTRNFPDGNAFTYTYDRNGRLLSAANNSGGITYTYDALGRIVAETFNGHTTAYGYSIPTRTVNMTYPNGTLVTKRFDQRWRPGDVSVNGQTVLSYAFNGVNQPLQKTYGNGITTTYQYDNMNRLSSFSSSNASLPALSFQYDKEGNKTVVQRNNDPQYSETFTYDANYRLTNYKQGVLNGNGIPSPLVQNSYAYDAVGNRTSAVLNGVSTSYTLNNANQYTSVGGVSFTYDGRGNRTYDGTFYSRYDANNRKLMDSATGMVLRYTYDALGRRVTQSINGLSVNYYYSGMRQIEERDAADVSTGTQLFEGSFMPLLRTAGGQRYFHHLNDLGSTEALTDNTGTLVERYKYDAFGKTSFLDASGNVVASSAAGNRFLFTGQEYNAQTGGYKFHYRNYDPATGAFVQRDPIGYADQMGLYQYVGNNPGSYTDPLGLAPCPQKNMTVDVWKTREGWANGIVSWMDIIISQHSYIRRIASLEEFIKDQNRVLNLLKAEKDWANAANTSKTLAKAEKLTEALKATKIGKATAGIKGLGLGLNFVDLGLNGFQLNETLGNYIDGSADGADVALASGNFAQSALGFTPPGALYNAADFVQSKITGKSMNEWSAEAGQVYGQKDYGEEDEKEAQRQRDNGTYQKWYETRKRMIRKQREWQVKTYNKTREQQNRTVGGGNGCPPNGPTPGNQNPPPPPPGQPGQGEVIFDKDPNAIVGPDGVGANKWVSVNDRLPYTILFENAKEATAPVKIAKVFYPIDPKQDINTFQLGSFGFNNFTFTVPANTNAYYKRLDVKDSLGIYVDVTAGIDAVSKQAFWIFESIDPTTLLPTTEPLKGFLLTQDSSKSTSGHGYVDFSIKPVSNAATRDTVSAYAEIVFGTNDTIPTNRHKNTIDAVPPASNLASLPAVTPNTEVGLHLSGNDDAGGSGLKGYAVYVSDNGGALQLYVDNFSKTDTLFRGVAKHTYQFYTAATDSAGNKETAKLAGTVRITDGEEVICPGGNVTFVAPAGGTAYQWQMDAGNGYVDLSEGGIYSGITSATLTLTGAPTSLYGNRYRALINGTTYGTEYLLKFGMTWEGTVSTAWENPANWSCGSLPDAATDVKILGEKPRYPLVNGSTAIRSLTTATGASVTVRPGVVLTVVK